MQKQPKVTIYIDAANLVLGSRNFVPTPYDIYYLLVHLKDRYRANKCIYFTGEFREYEIDYDFLGVLGVEIVFKKIYRQDEKTKANCDVEISHRITLDIRDNLVDKVVLVTGDGDFAPLLDYVKENNKDAKLFAVARQSTAYILTQRKYLNIVYLEDVVSLITKGKGPAGHVVPEGKLFIKDSIPPTQILSNEFFSRLDRVGLNKDSFIVVGGGVLQAKRIRRSVDIDLVVQPEVFEKLKINKCWNVEFSNTIISDKLPKREYLIQEFSDGKVELRKEFFIARSDKSFESGLDNYQRFVHTEVINGVRFESLKAVLMEKSYFSREKDLVDVELIKNYLKKYDN